MNSATTRGCRVSRAGAPRRPLEKRAARPRDARRTTPAWLFDTQTQFFFSNAKLSTKSGQAQIHGFACGRGVRWNLGPSLQIIETDEIDKSRNLSIASHGAASTRCHTALQVW